MDESLHHFAFMRADDYASVADKNQPPSHHRIIELLTLTLFVTRLRADHSNWTVTTNDFTVTTDFLYRCTYFHVQLQPMLNAL